MVSERFELLDEALGLAEQLSNKGPPSQCSRLGRCRGSRREQGSTTQPRKADLRAWFPSDAACLDYLDWLRWPDGFCGPVWGATKAWRLADGRW